jgi:hypothetical protein
MNMQHRRQKHHSALAAIVMNVLTGRQSIEEGAGVTRGALAEEVESLAHRVSALGRGVVDGAHIAGFLHGPRQLRPPCDRAAHSV